MDLSIIIPSFNTKDLLDRCLASVLTSLKQSKFSYEIIVVDNASEDGSRELLEKKYPRVVKIFNKSNLGYGRANNQGIKKASGRYILLLNSDIRVLDRAISDLYHLAQHHSRQFIGGKLFNEDGSSQPSGGPFYTLPVVFLLLFGKGDVWGITRYSPDNFRRVDWVSGACLMGAKDAFSDVGLFDEDIFMYMEEIDFLYRAREKGHTTFFYPQARFIHTGAASSGTRSVPVVNIYRGLLYFYRQHMSIMEQRALAIMLKLKAWISIVIGKIAGWDELVSTYEQALAVVG